MVNGVVTAELTAEAGLMGFGATTAFTELLKEDTAGLIHNTGVFYLVPFTQVFLIRKRRTFSLRVMS